MTAPVPCPARTRRGGFTFVELLVVVMLLGILAGVAAPRYTAAIAGVELEAAARQLAADLRYARQQALRRGRTVGVEFLPASDRYRTLTVDVDPITDPARPGQTLDSRVDRQPGIAMSSADFDGEQEVTFNFRGEPSAPGAVTITGGGQTYTVRVGELGGVTVE